MCTLLQKFYCEMIRTSPKFARCRVRNFIIFFLITLIITLTFHDPDKVIFNFFGHVLNSTKKSLLIKGLNFTIPPKNINYADFMIPFELLYSDANSLDVFNLNKEFTKSMLKESPFSSYTTLGRLLRITCQKKNLIH